jgi:hypothetical protein
MSKYLHRVFIALSVLLNVILGGRSNQTFSARNYQWKKDSKLNLVWLIDYLLGEHHCVEAWTYWIIRLEPNGREYYVKEKLR